MFTRKWDCSSLCCSKPLMYGIALDHLGSELVHQYVGQEPSGRNFNELVLDYNSEFTCGLYTLVLTIIA
jgi:glutaminase